MSSFGDGFGDGFGGDGASLVQRPSYAEFFLAGRSNVVQLELLEVSHPAFSQTYRFVRNDTRGVTVTLETGEVAAFNYVPCRITSLGARDDLESGFRVELGDLGEILPQELDRVAAADAFETKPVLTYRTYRSDDLTTPLFGPLTLEIAEVPFRKEGAAFEARAPSLNVVQTGDVYSVDRYPSLRGLTL